MDKLFVIFMPILWKSQLFRMTLIEIEFSFLSKDLICFPEMNCVRKHIHFD